jgi:2-polyprenyl-3-methyl-5-hydroxy-6-metoxy-1,4-benzoquinol methylase
MSQLSSCPICSSTQIHQFLHRSQVPIHQHLVIETVKDATIIQRGELSLAVCHHCGFVFNQSFDLNLLEYGENYDNAQTYSPFFEKYLDELAEYLIEDCNVKNSQILEIGCGQGHFLSKLVSLESANNYGYGCDPSYIPTPTSHSRIQFEQRYYGSDCTHIPVDVAICRHVIEHVPDPVGLLKSLRAALVNSPHARLFFETPCVDWILQHQVVWDFFYEHCSYFTASSLSTAFQQAGFDVIQVKHIFGGQYLWLEASIAPEHVNVTYQPNQTEELANRFAQAEQITVSALKTKIKLLTTQGNVALWGAGAKGVTLANLVDPDRESISAVIDLNPNKHNGYLPGTGHPIINYLDIDQYEIKSAVLMNPNYYQENIALLKIANLDLQLIE